MWIHGIYVIILLLDQKIIQLIEEGEYNKGGQEIHTNENKLKAKKEKKTLKLNNAAPHPYINMKHKCLKTLPWLRLKGQEKGKT